MKLLLIIGALVGTIGTLSTIYYTSSPPTTCADLPAIVEPEIGSVYITSILPNAIGNDKDSEWIKITNKQNTSINLKDYQLQIAEQIYELPDFTIYGQNTKTLPTKDLGLSLPNSPNTIKLLLITGKVIDTLNYPKPHGGQIFFHP
ncbi:MAG: lamin tail domain-containing protein [Candidatus Abawacabacteria bacterium]|nr:lamin tail domain-containing protein [Candidatus Abawacabacteria bacterium]